MPRPWARVILSHTCGGVPFGKLRRYCEGGLETVTLASGTLLDFWYNTRSMRVRLFCNGKESFVSPFVARFTASVCKAVVGSLKAPTASEKIQFELEGDRVQLQIDGTSVLLDKSQGFAETIVCDTIRGMVRHLKGIDPNGAIRIEIDLEGSHDKSQI